MVGMRAVGAAVLAGALLAAGCAAGCTGGRPPRSEPVPTTGPAAGTEPAGVAEVACAHVIGREPPPETYEVMLDVVALPTRTVLQASSSSDPEWLFAKQGLLVRAQSTAELIVPAEVAEHARIGWGSPAEMSHHVRVPACPFDPGWLAWSGGYEVDAPMCLPLVVRTAAGEQRVTIAVGTTCESGPRGSAEPWR